MNQASLVMVRPLRARSGLPLTRTIAPLCAAAILLGARLSWAQSSAAAPSSATGALERFSPAVPGDALLGVPSPSAAGHLQPRFAVVADYAYLPLSIQDGSSRHVIVSDQLFLHAMASLALFDRVLVSADMPLALAQGGASPTIAGVTFTSPGQPQAGDLRLGARLRLFGDFWDTLQLAVGGHIDVPTAPSGSYAGDGAVRGQPQILFGGRTQRFVYSASLGATLHASARPHTFDARAGAAVIFGDSFLQIGPEIAVAAPFTKDVVLDTPDTTISVASPVSAELLLGAKLRVLKSLVIGAGAGPGLSQGWGTPVFFAVGSVGYDPLPTRGAPDTDKDGIIDQDDACPGIRGVKSEDPKKNGCPPDTDGDTIIDADDACPKVPGVRSDDPKKNGCPPDADADTIVDPDDACPRVPGARSDDPKKNGCPPDTDADTILDADDACPTIAGIRSDDPKKNGCPPDTDEDGIADPQDACPNEKGGPDPDPKKHGCPHVTVTKTEIVILRQVKFRFGQSTLDQTVDPVSDDLLTEVRDAIVNHPEIKLIEVQGHADDVGPEEYNQHLSESRAQAVRSWLIKRGIASSKLVAKGYGSKVPVAANDTQEGRQKNRRVQFVIVKSDDSPKSGDKP